ncbi:MAG TPA: hypothetical protein VNO30_50685 [Kofleriaceae bacterium]|nr:hypothetical protein [Kofleriaceae bacterium]
MALFVADELVAIRQIDDLALISTLMEGLLELSRKSELVEGQPKASLERVLLSVRPVVEDQAQTHNTYHRDLGHDRQPGVSEHVL